MPRSPAQPQAQPAFEAIDRLQQAVQQDWEVLPDLFCRLDRQGKFQAVSQGWREVLGWSATELLGSLWQDWLHPQDRVAGESQWRSLWQTTATTPPAKTQFTTQFTIQFRHQDGTYRWLAWHVVLKSPGSARYAEALVRDITAYRQPLPAIAQEVLGTPMLSTQVAEVLRDVFWVYDPIAQKQLYVSSAYERIWGHSCQSLYDNPQSLENAIHPEDQAYVAERMAQGQNSLCIDLEYRICQPNGDIRWIHDRRFSLRDSHGQPYRLIGIAEDVTDRRQAELDCDRLFQELTSQRQTLENQVALRTTELRAIIDAIPDQIYVVRRDNLRIDCCNAAFAQAMGAPSPQALEGQTIFDCFAPDRATALAQQLQSVFDSGQPHETHETQRQADGRVQSFEITTVPLHHQDSDIYALVSAARDVSALKESEERLLAIFEQAAVGISLVNPDGQFQAVNQRFCELMGYSKNELLNMTFQQITDPHHLQADLAQYERLLAGEIQAFTLEKCFIRKDKQLQWVTLTVSGVYGKDGNMKYDIGVLQDISDRKQAEEEVLKALEKERELNELKSRVISMISHEYRTPLTIICSSAELLQRYGSNWLDERRNVHFERIQDSVQHLTALVNDVLFLNRAEANRLEFNPVYIDICPFFRELGETLKTNFHPEQTIEINCDEDCGQICVDEKLLRQILTNLFANALKYSPQGGIVRCTVETPDHFLRFAIQDHGIGIPEDDLPHLFESFHRGKNVGTIPGTGLGLSIVKKCVDIHQGQITVESRLGQGTTFKVTLPSFNP